jgi:hypothetical protein
VLLVGYQAAGTRGRLLKGGRARAEDAGHDLSRYAPGSR